MHLTLGSKSALKTKAVAIACESLGLKVEISPLAIDSEVSAQPIGQDETERGARNRAQGARAHAPDAFAAGIENGLRQTPGGWEDWAVIVVVCPDGTTIVLESDVVLFPSAVVEIARSRGFATTTAGQVLAEQTACDPSDPHSFLTNGSLSRLSLLTAAVKKALQLALDHSLPS